MNPDYYICDKCKAKVNKINKSCPLCKVSVIPMKEDVKFCKKVIINTGRERSPTILFGLVDYYGDRVVVTTSKTKHTFMSNQILQIVNTDKQFISGDKNG